jgi:hypothetical protein
MKTKLRLDKAETFEIFWVKQWGGGSKITLPFHFWSLNFCMVTIIKEFMLLAPLKIILKRSKKVSEASMNY